MRWVMVVGGVVAVILGGAGPASADGPCTGVLNQSGCQPAPWNGQLMDTWNIPGTYGGWTNTPVMCDPATTRCRIWAQP